MIPTMLRALFALMVVLVIMQPPLRTPGSSAQAAAPPLDDISGNPFEADIAWIYDQGITKGCRPSLYCPDQPVTREQMASFLARSLALPTAARDYFTDDGASAHEGDINRIAAAGIAAGCGSSRFCPAASVTRDQMAAFLHRALTRPNPVPPSAVPTPSQTATPSQTSTPSQTPTASADPTPSASPVITPSASATPPSTPTPSGLQSTFHVAPNGRDSNPGSAAAPWRSLQKAADNLPAGATVLVHSGTYAPFVVSRSGTAAAPVTFRGAPGEAAPVVAGNASTVNTIRIAGARHITVSGLIVQGADAHNKSAGIRVENGPQPNRQEALAITLSANIIRNNRGRGIELFNANTITISDNEIVGNAKGIHVGFSTGSVAITNNRIHHNDRSDGNGEQGGVGIGFNHTTGGAVATGNLVWGNRAPSAAFGYDGGAFEIFGASNVRIEGNTMWDNRMVLETGTSDIGCVNNVFARNVAYGAATVDDRTVGMLLKCAEGMLVANNTFYHLDDFVFVLNAAQAQYGASIAGLRILNNIAVMESGRIYGLDSAIPASVVIDRNLVTSGGIIGDVQGRRARDLATFRSCTGYDATGLSADPRFVNAAAFDFRLAAGSPAIDKGRSIAGVTGTYVGAGPDLGRFERGAS